MKGWVRELREEELEVVASVPQGRWRRYVSTTDEGGRMIFGMGLLEPGEKVGHEHVEEEVFYVLKGHGEATWTEDGEVHRAELRPGVAFYKGPHVHHTMHNTGKEPLVGLFFKV